MTERGQQMVECAHVTMGSRIQRIFPHPVRAIDRDESEAPLLGWYDTPNYCHFHFQEIKKQNSPYSDAWCAHSLARDILKARGFPVVASLCVESYGEYTINAVKYSPTGSKKFSSVVDGIGYVAFLATVCYDHLLCHQLPIGSFQEYLTNTRDNPEFGRQRENFPTYFEWLYLNWKKVYDVDPISWE